ncbi:MAG: hypothetical protein IH591_11680 [Bacteroidales bacterium]|nr:hypothetical protein [Bacteroidales bacterium]
MLEPLRYFNGLSPFDSGMVERFEIGEKYAGLMLNDGSIGVCAVLGQNVDEKIFSGTAPDLSNPGHRILLNAWFNAVHNYAISEVGNGDIFNPERFADYRNVVMIGSFTTLIEKFRQAGIAVSVFDRMSDEDFLIPMQRQPELLSTADCVILTGTSINNETFLIITNQTPVNCDVFLLGPSNILHRDMFKYPNIKTVFGSRFSKGDHQVLDLIRDGYGTKSFLKESNKVYISRNNS